MVREELRRLDARDVPLLVHADGLEVGGVLGQELAAVRGGSRGEPILFLLDFALVGEQRLRVALRMRAEAGRACTEARTTSRAIGVCATVLYFVTKLSLERRVRLASTSELVVMPGHHLYALSLPIGVVALEFPVVAGVLLSPTSIRPRVCALFGGLADASLRYELFLSDTCFDLLS